MVNVVGNGWTGRDPKTHVLQENHALYAHSFWLLVQKWQKQRVGC